jgi:hypothetical protein
MCVSFNQCKSVGSENKKIEKAPPPVSVDVKKNNIKICEIVIYGLIAFLVRRLLKSYIGMWDEVELE